MSFGITKTIPANQGIETIDKLYDGSISEYEFHMAGKPSKLSVGDYVYTIYGDKLYDRGVAISDDDLFTSQSFLYQL